MLFLLDADIRAGIERIVTLGKGMLDVVASRQGLDA